MSNVQSKTLLLLFAFAAGLQIQILKRYNHPIHNVHLLVPYHECSQVRSIIPPAALQFL